MQSNHARACALIDHHKLLRTSCRGANILPELPRHGGPTAPNIMKTALCSQRNAALRNLVQNLAQQTERTAASRSTPHEDCPRKPHQTAPKTRAIRGARLNAFHPSSPHVAATNGEAIVNY